MKGQMKERVRRQTEWKFDAENWPTKLIAMRER